MKKIDIHCHTTKRKVIGAVPESADLDTIKNEMKKYDIEKTILLATYFPHRGSGTSNFRLLHWIRDKPEFLMFGSLDFEHYFWQGINELNELAESNLIKGVKLYTAYQKIDLHSDKMKKIVDLANHYALNLAFHTGHSYTTMRKYGGFSAYDAIKPMDLEFIAEENPDINIVMCHLAKPFVDDLITVVNRNHNIYADSSGLLHSRFDRDKIPRAIEDIRRFVDACGPKKLLFGTDFSMQTHEDSVYFIEEAMKSYSRKDKRDVYYNNAKIMLKLC